ncbi:aminodeoxychorismate lyase [Pseudoxanthomonas suwonensis 11-1]|uniref:Endolytic murein transglycosylase n=1 Tax=Pseudoxanthomonas suwonensis (strain 11-1) TaxID=743721 RepID=E6WUR2_PSEUU|nr:endolytic transglycosylase MltG [Pseudoxanthomonas suwonensis]ADV27836.1 aminodeoxychorismate lyase [Pseudoxanthomonas suwonensis 11-1]
MAGGCKRVFGVALGLLFAVLVLAGGAAAWGWSHYQRFADSPAWTGEAPGSVRIERGDGPRRVIARLREAGITAGHDIEWRLLARQLGAAGRLKVGEYALEPGITPRELLQRMRDGRVIHYRVTIVEGWNFRQLRAALAAADPLLHEATELDDAALMEALGHSGQHPEGRFLPETYLYQRGDSDLDILRRAHAAMEQALAQAWEKRAPDTPLRSPEEALILASIVEKETGQAHERPQIAGVFSRRLQKGMLLQTDPTVIYGLGSAYDGNIRKRDLTTDTPYNTYTRPGLPPTPIAMPGRAALEAAVNPAPGDALFFVSRNDGSHVFSATYAEHNRAVDCFQRKRNCPAQGEAEQKQ